MSEPTATTAGCGHARYNDYGRCSEMSCRNYAGKFLYEDPKFAVTEAKPDERPGGITPVDPVAYAFASEQRLAFKHHADENFEQALEAAIELIDMAGFGPEDSDAYGKEMSDHTQTLLTMALMRCPQLAERILGRADDGVVIGQFQS
jgi:hypothetical protein